MHHLGLVVTDEQHRFGVRQRTMLGEKGDSAQRAGHVAPRPFRSTLSLIRVRRFGHFHRGRIAPGTHAGAVPALCRRTSARTCTAFCAGRCTPGGRRMWSARWWTESEAVEAVSAEQVYAELSARQLKESAAWRWCTAGMKSAGEGCDVWKQFRRGECGCSGVYHGHRGGRQRAQRHGDGHRKRGTLRAGAAASARGAGWAAGSFESWCFLMAEPNERLRLLTKTNDGFKIAEKDMELRGPGELFGYRQSGTLDAGLGALAGDTAAFETYPRRGPGNPAPSGGGRRPENSGSGPGDLRR